MNKGKFPPRTFLCFFANGDCEGMLKQIPPATEPYLSLEEHEHILTEAANKIERLQAKISELDQALLTARSNAGKVQFDIDRLVKEARAEVLLDCAARIENAFLHPDRTIILSANEIRCLLNEFRNKAKQARGEE